MLVLERIPIKRIADTKKQRSLPFNEKERCRIFKTKLSV